MFCPCFFQTRRGKRAIHPSWDGISGIGIGNVEPQKHAPGADLGQPEEAKFRKQAWDLAPGAALILPLVFSSDKCPSRI